MNSQNTESTPLISRQENGGEHVAQGPVSSNDSTKTSFSQTVFNIANLCMGTGTLGLPFSASQGGILGSLVGLFFITLWNIYSVDRLTKSLVYIQRHEVNTYTRDDIESNKDNERTVIAISPVSLPQNPEVISNNGATSKTGLTVDDDSIDQTIVLHQDGPHFSSTFGKVAWYAFGTIGSNTIDAIMMILMMGIVVAYEVAILGFIEQTSLTTGSKWHDAALVLLVIAPFACITEFRVIAKFSAFGIFTIIGVYIVVASHGIHMNGIRGFSQITRESLWPKSLSGFSHWFGVAAFAYGLVPFVYNIQESMEEPTQMTRASQIACMVVFVVYSAIGDIIKIIYLPSNPIFDGDVLSVLSNTWISTLLRLSMCLVMVTTIPLVLVPTGDLFVGKIGMANHKYASRATLCLRLSVCSFGAYLCAILPNFVYVISFLGCFCVAFLSFAYPPLVHLVCFYKFCPRHEWKVNYHRFCLDLFLLLLGTAATAFTSHLTYRTLMKQL